MGASVGDACAVDGFVDALSVPLGLISSVLGVGGLLGMEAGVLEGGSSALVSSVSVDEFSGSH